MTIKKRQLKKNRKKFIRKQEVWYKKLIDSGFILQESSLGKEVWTNNKPYKTGGYAIQPTPEMLKALEEI